MQTKWPHDESCELCGVERESKIKAAGRRAGLLANIRNYGFHKVGVFSEIPEEPSFSYSIGLYHTRGHPEIIILGLDIETEFAILDTIAGLIKEGGEFRHGSESSDILSNMAVKFVEFSRSHYGDYLGQAENFYLTDNFPVLMVAWPDRDGVFPWAEGSPEWLMRRQPALWSRLPSV
ncbi:DUF4262 domain-containing protein [Solwaraspora sp. WMMD792]|uniref:DUF4262 domain-containing protein n=1 Tax=Solwaraspora sp. WMMD792 TaxID=3016099 RepID=UPI0024169EC6|nr:DUF4262 domain-containing protein [Solwaraspora sp. WMMD792]MDG4769666.1 DUF4262 domain-containing protein [Solwaraspora sp. WMMD792]